VIKSRKMSLAGHVALMEEIRNGSEYWLESLKGIYHSEDLDIVGKIILKLIFRKYCGRMWTAQDRDLWRTFVNTVMNLRVP
jgi:hypothetical protein